ncbi:MAG: imidazole glycerol phosphate synthase subunit HisF [Parcubacteria group bacterium]|nr:imidazole glycerol phosphate synthase subunit HisF [Parcubacteria group bacterium]
MRTIRIIPRLDIKGPNVIKGVRLEALRVVGNPHKLATKYYKEGADELIFMDIVASLYERNNILDIVSRTARDIFVPLTVGGGMRSIEDIRKALRAGADKVAINTYATKRPEFVSEAAKVFGSQCIVGSIEAKRRPGGGWEAFIDNGRVETGLDVVTWAKRLVSLGAGELLVTSVDQEGTAKGYDIELIKKIAPKVSVPVIACGGAGNPEDILEVIQEGHADAVGAAHVFHYNKYSIKDVKDSLRKSGVGVRF